MAKGRQNGRLRRVVRGALWGSAGIVFAAWCGIYLASQVTTGHDPFRRETTKQPTTRSIAAPAKETRPPAVSRRCHLTTLSLKSIDDTFKKAQRCRLLKAENGVIVTVEHP